MNGKSTGWMLAAVIPNVAMAPQAAAADEPSATLEKCGEEKDDARRLACHDRAIGAREIRARQE